jgi:hypothetical protein
MLQATPLRSGSFGLCGKQDKCAWIFYLFCSWKAIQTFIYVFHWPICVSDAITKSYKNIMQYVCPKISMYKKYFTILILLFSVKFDLKQGLYISGQAQLKGWW